MTDIDSTAIVQKSAELEHNVKIGAYTIIGPHVKIGANSCIMAHVFLDGRTTIGAGCTIFPFASIGTQTQDLKYKGEKTFVEIGDNTTLREYVTVNSGTNEGDITRVGSKCHIMAYSHIAHQCIVGNNVIISNAGTLAGHVIIEDHAVLGGLCGIHQFVRIGRMSFLGGCSKATQDIPPYMLADGNPASVRGINAIGLQRKNIPEETRNILKEAYKILYRHNITTQNALKKIKEVLQPCHELEQLVNFVSASTRGIAK